MLHHEQNKLFFNSFLQIYFKLLASLNFLILSQCLVSGPQVLEVDSNCLKCNSGINLVPANNSLLTILFTLNSNHFKLH